MISLCLAVSVPLVLAKENGEPGNGNMNENKNEVMNQGEESQLQEQEMENEQEMEGASGQFGANRSENAFEHMSTVAARVMELQQLGDREGGLGEQVREFAREQNQTQEKLDEDLQKLEDRRGWMKWLAGPDYKAIKNVKAQMTQNQVRIEQLRKLSLETQNESDAEKIRAMIMALDEAQVALQERVQAEEGTKSMLGWLFRFMNR